MSNSSRRSFFGKAAAAGAAVSLVNAASAASSLSQTVSLNGEWQFQTDPANSGPRAAAWRSVTVPHTWQIEQQDAGYMGAAWYRRSIDVPAAWKGSAVRIRFESVYHSAEVQVNGRPAGKHIGKGYTAFTLDITKLLNYDAANEVLVKADNAFNDAMLPRGQSFDWTPDGGVYRPVWLLVTPPVFVERVEIDALPGAAGAGSVAIRASVANTGVAAASESVELLIFDQATGLQVAAGSAKANVAAGSTSLVPVGTVTVPKARLWHFDQPNLYTARVSVGEHSVEETFGIRKIEVLKGVFHLNGEPMRLMGVERMAGSNPRYGMAEPPEWIEHDNSDLKNLNCVFTRVHWMQDQRLVDWCDRHGMLIQLEVPTWGPDTWKGMTTETTPAILENGLAQLREMIQQNRNHPSVFAWGLCNEIGGANPPAKKFAQAMFREARRMDPQRLLSYASNTLHIQPAEDVAGEMDILEWNEYYESWYGGNPDSVRQALKKIRAVYPDKMIVISEYGLCECDPKNPTSDEKRIQILKTHDAVYREEPIVGGLIFFCYNDYRTHIGDKGIGVMKQRVHGVVDLFGARKPSYDVLRGESSTVQSLALERRGDSFEASLRTRTTVPSYTLRGYKLRFTLYGFGGLPMEQIEEPLPDLKPGASHLASVKFRETNPKRVVVEVVRPTGPSVLDAAWSA